MDQDGFDKMNYRDLQKLAKTAGVKANLPKAELIKALQENAANDSGEDSYQENAPSKTEPSKCENKDVTKNVLNTTFEVEDTPEESNELNRTFDKLTPEPERRKSTRLSVETLTTSSRFVEIMNSPKPRDSSSGPITLSVPIRPGASVGKNTPRVSSARKPTGRKSLCTPGASRKVSTPSTLKSIRKDSGKKIPMATNIPRFVKFARKVPDFAKMHEREFMKMESLDTYLDKKKKRTEMTMVQMNKAKTLAEEHINYYKLPEIRLRLSFPQLLLLCPGKNRSGPRSVLRLLPNLKLRLKKLNGNLLKLLLNNLRPLYPNLFTISPTRVSQRLRPRPVRHLI